MPTRAEILDTLAASQTQVMAFFQGLSPEDLERPATANGVPGEAPWRPRDHLAHLVKNERNIQQLLPSNLPTGDDRAPGLVDFSVFPHLDHPESPDNSLANAEKWAARRSVPTYAIDDQTAIKVIDGAVSVVSEGHWKRFTP